MRILLMLAWAMLFIPAAAVAAEHGPFSAWLSGLREEARSKGISDRTLNAALQHIEPDGTIIRLDRKQPEGTITLSKYVSNTVTPQRIRKGREMMHKYRTLLTAIGKEYGVQPRFIVALWGIETNFGANTGGFYVIEALATLAYDGRRSAFFREELLHALTILDQNHIGVDDMQGSWAGAMGQCQFMPSTFLKHAVDYNKDGKLDIWNTQADVFASIANYLKSLGWKDDETWGRPVKLPKGFDTALMDIAKEKTISQWKKLGVRKADGSPLPDSTIRSSVIWVGEPGKGARAYIVYHDFKALLEWNRSRFFATAVGTLADRIGD